MQVILVITLLGKKKEGGKKKKGKAITRENPNSKTKQGPGVSDWVPNTNGSI